MIYSCASKPRASKLRASKLPPWFEMKPSDTFECIGNYPTIQMKLLKVFLNWASGRNWDGKDDRIYGCNFKPSDEQVGGFAVVFFLDLKGIKSNVTVEVSIFEKKPKKLVHLVEIRRISGCRYSLGVIKEKLANIMDVKFNANFAMPFEPPELPELPELPEELDELEKLAKLSELEALTKLAELEELDELEKLAKLSELEALTKLAELEELEALAELPALTTVTLEDWLKKLNEL